MKNRQSVFVTIVWALACGLLVIGCSRSPREQGAAFPALSISTKPRLLINTGAVEQGRDGQVVAVNLRSARRDYAKGAFSTDSTLRLDEDRARLYVLNRDSQDGIHVLDAKTLQVLNNYPTHFKGEPRGMNPQDIAIVSDSEAYVSRLQSRYLVRIHPFTGEYQDQIDLGPLAEPGQLPHMTKMFRQGDRLGVLLGRLIRTTGNWRPSDYSSVALVDTRSRTLLGPVPLLHRNPVTEVFRQGAALFVGSSDYYGLPELRGGIARLDPTTFRAVAPVITETELDGNLFDFVLAGEGRGFAVVYTRTFQTKLVQFTFGAGVSTIVLETAPTDSPFGRLAYHPEGYLFVADRHKTTPGVRVYDAKDPNRKAIELFRFSVGLPPLEILISE